MVSSGCLAFRSVLALGCAAWALAERATEPLDDGVSMMQVARWISAECVHTNGEARDALGNNCGACYKPYREAGAVPACCSSAYSDDDDFTYSLMCCDCAGGRSPTPTPTTAAPRASAAGDPRVTNIDGARFDIGAGVHELLRLPRRGHAANRSRGAVEQESLLSVVAKVGRADEDWCGESYVKQVGLSGVWLNSSGPLRFLTAGSEVDDARAISMWVNGAQVDAAALRRDSRVQPFLEVTEPRTTHGNHASSTMQKVRMFTVKLSFASATLKIDWIHRSVPRGLSLNHLNFHALGLQKFLEGSGMDIGGILGRDDHSDAASLPEDCKAAGSNLMASHRPSGDGGGQQIISAAL